MEWLKYVIAILSGLATCIPLVVQLVKYVSVAIKERNWNQLVTLVMNLMAEAEGKFNTGLERKEWVLAMVEVNAKTINYDIDMQQVSDMIDALCDLTKVVNPPVETVEE